MELIAPSPPGLSCTEVTESTHSGCHALAFSYAAVGKAGERLMSIHYLAPGNGGASEGAHYEYNSAGHLIAEWDPRISPALKAKYA